MARKPIAAYTESTESERPTVIKSDKPLMRLAEWNPRSGYIKPSDRRFLGLGTVNANGATLHPVYKVESTESTGADGKVIKSTVYTATGETVNESTVASLTAAIKAALGESTEYRLFAEYHTCESGTVATFAVSAPESEEYESDDLMLLSTVGATLEQALSTAADTLTVATRAPESDPADTKPGLKRHWDTVIRPSTVKPLARVRAYLTA